MAGRIEGLDLVRKFADVGHLSWLRQVKESKAYKAVGTWGDFCKIIGLSASTANERLQNLEELGADFLTTVGHLRIGYRDLRAMRRISHDGELAVDEGTVTIAGEEIPLDAEHVDDLQAALARYEEDANAEKRAAERLAASKDKHARKLEKDLAKYEQRAAELGLSREDHAFVTQCETLQTSFDGYLLYLDPGRIEHEIGGPSDIKRAKLMSTISYMRMRVLALYDQLEERYAHDLVVDDSERWSPPEA